MRCTRCTIPVLFLCVWNVLKVNKDKKQHIKLCRADYTHGCTRPLSGYCVWVKKWIYRPSTTQAWENILFNIHILKRKKEKEKKVNFVVMLKYINGEPGDDNSLAACQTTTSMRRLYSTNTREQEICLECVCVYVLFQCSRKSNSFSALLLCEWESEREKATSRHAIQRSVDDAIERKYIIWMLTNVCYRF